MIESVVVSPPNSLLLIMDPSFGVVPESMEGGLIQSTSTCVAIGTLSEFDGETKVVLTNSRPADPNLFLVFDGQVATPNLLLSVCTVDHDQTIATVVSSNCTNIEVWVNHSEEPNLIVVFMPLCQSSSQ